MSNSKTIIQPLSKQRVEEHIAEQERRIEAERTVRDKLQELADDAHREVLRLKSQLGAFRALVEERGVIEP